MAAHIGYRHIYDGDALRASPRHGGRPRLDPLLLRSYTLIDASRSLGLTRVQRFRKVLLPSLAPGILLGLRVSAPLALIITILVEIVTRVNGIGALMGEAQANYRSAQVYGLLTIAGILGFAVNWVVTHFETGVTRRMNG